MPETGPVDDDVLSSSEVRALDVPPGCGDLVGGAILFGIPACLLLVTASVWISYSAALWGPVIYLAALLLGGVLLVRGITRNQVTAHGAAFVLVAIAAAVGVYLLPL